MKKIGITGTIASGKSTVSILLKRRGYAVFNCDQYAKLVYQKTSPVYPKIIDTFGNEILDENGEVNRTKLAAVVFSDTKKLEALNALTHPFVKQGIETFFLHHERDELVFAEVPLLFESHMESRFNAILLVTTKKETAIKRMKENRGYSEEEALKRYEAQMPADQKRKLADYVIENDGTLQELNGKVFRFLKEIKVWN